MATIVTEPGTSYTLTDSDDQTIILFTSSSAITVTCPGTVTAGVEIVCVQAGTGQITFVTSGVGNILNSIIPTSRSERAYVAITLESNGNFMFNGKMGIDKVLVSSNYAAVGAPTVNDDDTLGYEAGSIWLYNTSYYICMDATTGAADWNLVPQNGILPDGTVPFTADQSMGSNKLTNVTDPTADQDAATKNYVDSMTYEVTPTGSYTLVAADKGKVKEIDTDLIIPASLGTDFYCTVFLNNAVKQALTVSAITVRNTVNANISPMGQVSITSTTTADTFYVKGETEV